jgi:hypothetical protein
VSPLASEPKGVSSAAAPVVVGIAVEDVEAGTAQQIVAARAAADYVVAGAAGRGIVAGSAQQHVGSVAAVQPVAAFQAEQIIVAGTAGEIVVAAVEEGLPKALCADFEILGNEIADIQPRGCDLPVEREEIAEIGLQTDPGDVHDLVAAAIAFDMVIALRALQLVVEAAAEQRVAAFVAPFVHAMIGVALVYEKIAHFRLHRIAGAPFGRLMKQG